MNSLIIRCILLASLAKSIYSIEYQIDGSQISNDILEHEEVVFTCKFNSKISITEREGFSVSRYIVKDSVLLDDRFTYMNITENNILVHKITLKDILRTQPRWEYSCIKSGSYEGQHTIYVYVVHKQDYPICITNFYTKRPDESIKLECVAKDAYPLNILERFIPDIDVSYSFLDSDEYYVSNYYYGRNETHVRRTLEILDHIEDISIFSCNAYQYRPPDVLFDVKSCQFDNSTTDTSTPDTSTPDTSTPTPNKSISTPDKSIPDTSTVADTTKNKINADGHSNGESIYGSVILILVCLLIH